MVISILSDRNDQVKWLLLEVHSQFKSLYDVRFNNEGYSLKNLQFLITDSDYKKALNSNLGINSTFFEWTSERFDDLWNIETELLQEVKNQSYLEMLGVKFRV